MTRQTLDLGRGVTTVRHYLWNVIGYYQNWPRLKHLTDTLLPCDRWSPAGKDAWALLHTKISFGRLIYGDLLLIFRESSGASNSQRSSLTKTLAKSFLFTGVAVLENSNSRLGAMIDEAPSSSAVSTRASHKRFSISSMEEMFKNGKSIRVWKSQPFRVSGVGVYRRHQCSPHGPLSTGGLYHHVKTYHRT